MALAWTTTELLAAIRSDARLADDDPEATDAILLREATRVLHETYVPLVRVARADYYLTTARIPIVATRASYQIPRRAATASVRRVRVLDANRRPAELAPISIEDLNPNQTSTRPTHFAISDDRIVLGPTPSLSDAYTLEVMFEYAPAALVLPAACEVIPLQATTDPYAFTSGAQVVAFDFATDFDTGDLLDVVRKNAPFSSPILDGDATVVAVPAFGDVVTFSDWIGEYGHLGIVPGDYVCFAGESPIPQIPAELHPSLARYTAAQFLEPIAPEDAMRLRAQAEAATARLLKAMAPRKQGGQMKMRPRTRFIGTSGSGRAGGTFGDLS